MPRRKCVHENNEMRPRDFRKICFANCAASRISLLRHIRAAVLLFQVAVNTSPMQIYRGQSRFTHKPLYLKKFCHLGRNEITISAAACCCVSNPPLCAGYRFRPVGRFWGLEGQNTFLGVHDFCYYIFKTNFSGNKKPWGTQKKFEGALPPNAPPVATGLCRFIDG